MTFEEGILDADGKPVDRLGRQEPHRFNVITWIRAIPGFIDRFRSVPETHYAAQGTSADVLCPCGDRPNCETGRLVRCGGCERIFLYTGRELLVANTPPRMEEAPLT